MTSDVTTRARALVAERLPEARGLGQALADLIDDPEAFVAVLRDGFERLADAEYAAEQERLAPASGEAFGVRWPLVDAVAAQLRTPLRESSPASALWLAQRLAAGEEREVRLFSHVPLRRALPADPERSWQLIRRLARAAGDWISVDTLADLVAQGILLERFRWAELEQLVYSANRWERRLVGSTIARLPFQLPPQERPALAGTPALTVIKSLIGDRDEQVQKSLSWALREWTAVEPGEVTRLLREQAAVARRTDDGHRAWVIRDALSSQSDAVAAELRSALAGIRRHSDAPATSEAALIAASFAVGAPLDDLSERAVASQGERQGHAGPRA
ncbi:MAG TPA: DNA alkylation repair protein [Candidatus Caenarcaniphilales bacterium]|nr:DNA alkylation repair protein [Candidatus Caenarcaniphilales bacterium]